jgi:hypothetical protein
MPVPPVWANTLPEFSVRIATARRNTTAPKLLLVIPHLPIRIIENCKFPPTEKWLSRNTEASVLPIWLPVLTKL